MDMQDNIALRTPFPRLQDDNAIPISAVPVSVAALEKPAQQTIRDCVEHAMRNYLNHLDGCEINNIYEMVLAEVEAPLLEVVLQHVRYNQSRASEMLGLNRGTLRKKMKQFGLL